MRRAVLLASAAVLLVGPTVLAFFSGGYFDGPRLTATLVAWVIVLVVAVASPRPFPTSAPGRAALAGMALIALWTGLSLFWAPLSDPATDSLVRLFLYLGVLLGAMALLRDELAARSVEPVLAAGVLVIILYGLSERLAPGVVDLTDSARAFGRLEQPITYWNAEGALAALGFVLCVRLAGAQTRPPLLRLFAAAAAPTLGLGVYLSYSRGAIAAALLGLVVLVATAPYRSQLWAAVSALGAALVVAACAAPLPAVASLEGSLSERELQGAAMCGVLVLAGLVAGYLAARFIRVERLARFGRSDRLRLAPRLPAVAAAAAILGLGVLVGFGLSERGGDRQEHRRGLARLGSVESRRYDYWRVGLGAYAGEPVRGIGAGGFRVEWLRERPIREGALEIHSLPLEMLVELGVPGVLGFALLVGGVGFAARRALRRSPALAPGVIAATTVWLLHASIDWDWQLPAVTVPAVLAAATLVAVGERALDSPREPSAGSAA